MSGRATWIGASAVPMWALLGPLTTFVARLPPLQVLASSFGIALVVTLLLWAARGTDPRPMLRLPVRVWALGVGGLFGYHLLYFSAFHLGPPAEVNLLNYLWPLLIVLFSALLPGHRLSLSHVLGALAGFAGAVLLVAPGLHATGGSTVGYVLAVGAAIVWSGYSVLNRRFAHVPSDAVGLFCGVTALLAALLHIATESSLLPTVTEWLVLLVMGALPVGAAFYVWDYGCKRGDIRALGALAYATPLLSTLLMGLLGRAEMGFRVWASCALIVGGAVLSGGGLFRRARAAQHAT